MSARDLVRRQCHAEKSPWFLFMLYGTLEYDGRAQRLLEVLGTLGSVFVIDVAQREATDQAPSLLPRQSVRIPAGMGKVRRHLRFWLAAIRAIVRARPQVVVSANYFTAFPGWIGAMLTRALFVYDAYELVIPEPGEAMSGRDRFWYWSERLVVRRANLVTAANKERAGLMEEHYGLACTPVVMQNIPPGKLGTSGGRGVAEQYPELVRRGAGARVVFYQGNIDLSRGIARFVLALAQLPLEYRMVVVGGGPDLERLREIGRPFENAGRLAVLGQVRHCLLPAITAMADVGIVTYPFHGLNNVYCAPNKVFEYAQAGVPVVATDQPPLRRLVECYGIGELVSERQSPGELAAVIQKVAENKTRYTKAFPRFLQDHRWEDEAARVRAAVADLLGVQRGAP